MTYAIERIGYGKRTRYTIRAYAGAGSNPTNGKAYRTEQAAREAAQCMGITIDACGDLWEILSAIR
jgi:hypothetical protein